VWLGLAGHLPPKDNERRLPERLLANRSQVKRLLVEHLRVGSSAVKRILMKRLQARARVRRAGLARMR
jgi:hypothetical protein